MLVKLNAMLRCAVFACWVAALAISGGLPSQVRATEQVVSPMAPWVEADWIAQDKSSFSIDHTRVVIARAQKLAQRLSRSADRAELEEAMRGVAKVEQRLGSLERAQHAGESERKALYIQARESLRHVAFANPALKNIQRLLFVKKHDAGGYIHMCDQYYGCNAKPGGGLFVLEQPFGESPELVNLLANAKVESGRMAGDRLNSGSFLSPEVSYDGKTVLFAYSQAKAKKTYQWEPEFSYHLFKVNADGTQLQQLTDGPWNDFDPCILPNGRVVFVSERRGGYLRCGRHCPTYTLFSMAPDGTDICHLSFHETHEWHPSVNNGGMIVYTRWDYVDRDSNIAHHIWTCYPDGRDPRTLHGNYPQRRESRPWMEMNIRSIPNSPLYVGVAAAHHGHEFGSLILIDLRVPDDGAMSQITRLTPEMPFPESEKGVMAYGTPWPLSEDDYLCVCDLKARNRGIYWIDRDGNRELVYRDPTISCISPMPLQARPQPPVIPEQAGRIAQGANINENRAATVHVLNVYESDFAWPTGTKITALRIIQLLPKTTAPPNNPRIGVADQTNARAVLGTVPVEADGSALFEAPAGKPLYFQALDERGLAVQSMRSITYFQPGERMTCQGCHERKLATPHRTSGRTLAMSRPPSKMEPEADGSNPFNYVRLVQPALDRNCVPCHQEKKALDLSGVIEGNNGWLRSYQNLAKKYGFYFNVSNGSIHSGVHGGSRTIAGRFGAKAAPLMKYLEPSHYNVRLSREDYRRLTLWLDCNSEFFGAYENTQAQARGIIVQPELH